MKNKVLNLLIFVDLYAYMYSTVPIMFPRQSKGANYIILNVVLMR